MLNPYDTLRGLVIAEDKILTQSDKEKLLTYIDKLVFEFRYDDIHSLRKENRELSEKLEKDFQVICTMAKEFERTM